MTSWGGGFGYSIKRTRPAPGEEGFKRKRTKRRGPDLPVPERLKNVRLHRRKRNPKMRPTPMVIQIIIVAGIVGIGIVVWNVVTG